MTKHQSNMINVTWIQFSFAIFRINFDRFLPVTWISASYFNSDRIEIFSFLEYTKFCLDRAAHFEIWYESSQPISVYSFIRIQGSITHLTSIWWHLREKEENDAFFRETMWWCDMPIFISYINWDLISIAETIFRLSSK